MVSSRSGAWPASRATARRSRSSRTPRASIRSARASARAARVSGWSCRSCAAILANGKRCPNATLPGSKYCGVPAHQELALHDSDDEELVVTEAEPGLEALADTMEPDAESVGPSLPGLEVSETDSAAPADVAATHGPDAVAVASAEGEVDLDTVVPHPQRAAGEDDTGGIPVEAEETE